MKKSISSLWTSRKLMIQLGGSSFTLFLLRLVSHETGNANKNVNETYSRVRVGKNLSDVFPIRNGWKQGDAQSPLLFNYVLEYALRGFK